MLRLVERHRVAGLVAPALAGLAVPERCRAAIARHAARIARHNLALAAEAVRLTRRLADAGIPAACLKGATLAQIAHGSLALRHAKDIDLLVPAEAAPRVAALLEAEGYRRTLPAPRVGPDRLAAWCRRAKNFSHHHAATGIEVELHWRLLDDPGQFGAAPPPEAWVAVPIGDGLSLHTLARDDLLIYLLGHGAHHGWFRLKWLADIATLAAGLSVADLAALLERAEGRGVGRAAAQGLVLAALLWPRDLPEGLVEAAGRGALRRLIGLGLAALCDEAEPSRRAFGPTRIRLGHYWLAPGWRSRWSVLLGQIDSAEDWAMLRLPRGLGWLYPALRLPLWLSRLMRRRAATGSGAADSRSGRSA